MFLERWVLLLLTIKEAFGMAYNMPKRPDMCNNCCKCPAQEHNVHNVPGHGLNQAQGSKSTFQSTCKIWLVRFFLLANWWDHKQILSKCLGDMDDSNSQTFAIGYFSHSRFASLRVLISSPEFNTIIKYYWTSAREKHNFKQESILSLFLCNRCGDVFLQCI